MLTNRSIYSALLVVAASTGFAQSNDSDWKATNVSAVAIAKKADSTLKTLKGVDAAVSMRIGIGNLGKGIGYFVASVRSPSVFRVEYPRYVATGFVTEALVKNNQAMARLGRDAPAPKLLKNDPDYWMGSDASFMEAFPKAFARQMFSGLIGGNTTLTRFVQLATKGVSGYRSRVETRQMTVAGTTKKRRNYRILIDRPAKGKLPKSHMELVFDAEVGLPVNIQSEYGTFSAGWLARWRNGQKFDQKLFQISS